MRMINDLYHTQRADTKTYRYYVRTRLGNDEVWRIRYNLLDTPDACGWDNWEYVCDYNDKEMSRREVKVFWSVRFRNWGADSAGTAWFNNEEEANDFYNSRNYVDPPVSHYVSAQKTIEELNELCQLG